MTIVVDAVVVVAALVDEGADGTWARAGLRFAVLAAPEHVAAEVSNVLRRAVLSGAVGRDARLWPKSSRRRCGPWTVGSPPRRAPGARSGCRTADPRGYRPQS